MTILSATQLFSQAINKAPDGDLNEIHFLAWNQMLKARASYYESKVDEFIKQLDMKTKGKDMLRKKMLEPVVAGGVKYSNFMEEAARRISQSFQTTSGRIAELCVRREVEVAGLKEGSQFTHRRGQGADIIVYYPNKQSEKKRHRVEVKNVTMRERMARGFSYDGDSLIGFFGDKDEFDKGSVAEIERLCAEKKGYFYLPPDMFKFLKRKCILKEDTRIKPNTIFSIDMINFSKTGDL